MPRLREVDEGLWQLTFWLPNPTNCWFVEEDDGLTLVDAALPWCGRAILRAVARLRRPLRRMVLTHAHPDHAGAMAWLARAVPVEVAAHGDDIPYLDGSASLADVRGDFACSLLLRVGRRLGLLAAPAWRDIRSLDEGDRVGRLRVLHTPGHTPGAISLYDERRRALFSGDNVVTTFGRVHLGRGPFTLDRAQRDRSIATTLRLPATLLLPGHGNAWRGSVSDCVGPLVDAN